MIALALVLTGLAVLVVSPVIQRLIDRATYERLLILGFVLMILGLALDVWVSGFGLPSAIAALTLAWAALTYIVLCVRLALIRPPRPQSPEEHCISKLVRGQNTDIPQPPAETVNQLGIASGLRYAMLCRPTDSSLYEYCWSIAYDYYVFWTSVYEVFLERTITISCEVKDGKCVIAKPISALGPKELKDRSLIGEIGEQIEYADDTLTIVVVMGVALGAADVTVTPKASKGGIGATVTIKFKNASRESPACDLGTFVWKCMAETAGTGPGTGASVGSGTGTLGGGLGTGTGTGTTGGTATGTGTGAKPATEPVRATCANTHPDIPDCVDDLDGFDYDSYEELIEAVEEAAGERITRVETDDQDERGPCPGAGEHYNFYGRSGKFHGSGFSCKCCQDTADGPEITTKYKYNG